MRGLLLQPRWRRCFDVNHQFVQIGALFNTGTLHRVADALDRRKGGVEHDAADRLGRLIAVAAHGAGHVATTLFNLDLHIKLATLREVGNDVLGVDDFDVVRGLDVAGGNSAFAIFAQAQGHFFTVVQLEDNALEVEQDVDYVFLHAVNRGVLMQDASDGDLGGSVAWHGREQDAAQCIAERVTITALEGLQSNLGPMGGEMLDVDGFGFQ